MSDHVLLHWLLLFVSLVRKISPKGVIFSRRHIFFFIFLGKTKKFFSQQNILTASNSNCLALDKNDCSIFLHAG